VVLIYLSHKTSTKSLNENEESFYFTAPIFCVTLVLYVSVLIEEKPSYKNIYSTKNVKDLRPSLKCPAHILKPPGKNGWKS